MKQNVNNKTILINSISNFLDDDGSMQKIARSFVQLGYKVIYIEKPLSFLNLARNWKIIFTLFNRIFSKKSNSLQNNLVIYNPGIFPILGYFFDYFRKEYENKKLRKLQYNNFDFIINYDPLGDYFIDLCSKFYKKSSILFYNTQDFLETPQPNFLKQIRSKSLSKMYNYKNIKIIVSNPNLSKYGKYHLLLFGGVELDKFRFRFKDIDPKNINVIYHGTFNVALDYELILELVKSNPRIKFNFLGSIKDSNPLINKILSNKNVQYYDPIPYSDVGSMISQFDIGFIPYKVDKLTDSVTSLKLYEYLSLGMPVVTTSYSEAKKSDSKLFFLEDSKAFKNASLLTKSDLKNNFKNASEKSWLSNAKKIIRLNENTHFK
tara:strand:- start:7954 stop:9084 length:1131 start_codon:yes stop_codon:yes gene_type:complete